MCSDKINAPFSHTLFELKHVLRNNYNYRYMNGMSVHVVIHVYCSAAITLYSVQAVMSQLSEQDQESIAKEQEKLEQEHKV